MTEWTPRNKYEVAPGLFIGSEIADIDREIKTLLGKLLDGDDSVMPDINRLSDRRMELMKPARYRRPDGTIAEELRRSDERVVQSVQRITQLHQEKRCYEEQARNTPVGRLIEKFKKMMGIR